MASDNWDDYLVGGADTSGATNITHTPDLTKTGGAAFLENIGRGVTMNGTDYANAGLLSTWNRQPGQSFGDAFNQHLANIRARNAQVQQDHPIASTAGNITGNVIGTALAPGKGILANMGKNAVQGGVTNYTSSPDTTLGSVGTQAGLSAGLSGLLGVTGAGITKGLQYTGITSNLNKLSNLYNDATSSSITSAASKKTLMGIFGSPEWEDTKNLAKMYKTMGSEPESASMLAQGQGVTEKLQNAVNPLKPSESIPQIAMNVLNPSQHPYGLGYAAIQAATDPGNYWEKMKSGAAGYAEGVGAEYAAKYAAKNMYPTSPVNNFIQGVLPTITPAAETLVTPALTPKNDWNQYEVQPSENQSQKTDWSQYEVK